MAGRGSGGEDDRIVVDGVGERSFFAPPIDPKVPRPPDRSLAAVPGGEAIAPSLPPTPAGEPSRRTWSLLPKAKHVARDAALAARLEVDRGGAFLLVPVFLAAGVILYFIMDFEPDLLRPAAIAVAAGVLALLLRSRPAFHLCSCAVLLVAAGVQLAKFETWRAQGQALGSEISTVLTGRVVSMDWMDNGRVRLTLDVVATQKPKLRYQPARVRVSARKVPAGIAAGSLIVGSVRLLPPSGPVRPQSYDFSFESYFDGIGASGFFMSNPKLVPDLPSAAPLGARFSAAVESARESIAERIRAKIGGAEGEIAAALIVGVRAGIPNSINEAMRRTGIYHIISISGLHMALVAGTVMALLRGMFGLFPDLSSRRPVKKYAAAAALVSIASYLFISGMEVAAERSFIMLAVMLAAVLFDRAALSMRNLAISAIVVIAVSPHEVMGPSFQMSFAATAALIGAYAGWADYRSKENRVPPKRSVPGALAHKMVVATIGLAVTSIVAGSATALFAVWHFQRVSPLSLFANLAVMPIVSFTVMPFAVLASLAMPFGIDGPFLYVMGKGLTAMIAISDWISARSPLDGVGLISLHSVLLVTVALVIATMATTWLRLLALPFAAAGMMTIGDVRTPDVLVSEDGRLVAMPIGGGELAVNRKRASEFTVENWKRALDAETVVEPETLGRDETRTAFADVLQWPAGTPFRCTDELCVASNPTGAIVARATDETSARLACGFANLIVIGDATAKDPCNDPLVTIITTKDLARFGSAAIFLDESSADMPAEVQYAVRKPYRPWHVQRQFSREARGLPPRQNRSAFKGKKSRQPQ